MLDYQFIVDYFKEFPALIQLAWILSALIFVTIVLLTIYLKMIRSVLRKKDLEIKKFKEEYEGALVEYLYTDSDDDNFNEVRESIILKLKKDVPLKSRRKIIIKILYNLMNEVSGEMSDSIKMLYYETGLIDYALARLKNKNWYIIAKGIGELTRFRIEEAYVDVNHFINHKRREVRKETQLYLVNMFRFDGLSFLHDLESPLSE